MEVTSIGYVIFFLSILFFIFKPINNYYMFVFFIPFSGTVIVNISSLGTGLIVSHFLGLLVILKLLWDFFTGKLVINKKQNKYIIFFIIFTCSILLSLIMPIILKGDINIYDYETTLYTPITLNSYNFTQTAFVIFGIIITTFVILINKTNGVLLKSIRVYLSSGFFISIWGFYQLICFYLGLNYPKDIFNNNINVNAAGVYQHFTDINVKRISSVSLEPSMFSQVLLSMIAILLYCYLNKVRIFSTRIDALFIIIMTAALVFSTSSTSILGLLLLILILMIDIVSNSKIKVKYVLFFLISSIGILILVVSVPLIQELLNKILFSKLASQSGETRVSYISEALKHFFNYPLLGVGWGSVKSQDLFGLILSNIGIIGLISYLLPLFIGFKTAIKYNSLYQKTSNSTINVGMMISLSLVLFVSAISGLIYYLPHYWFIFGLFLSVPLIREEAKNTKLV